MWTNWIAAAQNQHPSESLLAVRYASGEGFFSLGEARKITLNDDWSKIPESTPIVGGVSFLGQKWGAWSEEEFFQPKTFVSQDEQGSEKRARNDLGLEPIPYEARSGRHSLYLDHAANLSEQRKLWDEFCQEIDLGITEEKWIKIVPMRTSRGELSAGTPTDLADLWARLLERSPSGSNLFLWSRAGEVFLGASPELLFSINKGIVSSQAIAGTADHNNETELFGEKIQREHQIVVDDILGRIKECFGAATSGQQRVLAYGNIAHLCTPIQASEAANPHCHASAHIALRGLHPTPAVGGMPATVAMSFLAEREPWERGYFAAPIGFSFNGSAKFLVAIRSAKIHEEGVDFFAGAGYVSGSTANGEWIETEKKMQFMKNILGAQE